MDFNWERRRRSDDVMSGGASLLSNPIRSNPIRSRSIELHLKDEFSTLEETDSGTSGGAGNFEGLAYFGF